MQESVKKFSQIRAALKKEQKEAPLLLEHLRYLISPRQEIKQLISSLMEVLGAEDCNVGEIQEKLIHFERLVGSGTISMSNYNKSQRDVDPETQLGKMLQTLICTLQDYIKECCQPTYLKTCKKTKTQQICEIDKWSELREVKMIQKEEERLRQLDDIQRYRQSVLQVIIKRFTEALYML